MLEITDAAIDWIRSNRKRHGIPVGYGVRLFRQESGTLAVRSSPEPEADEDVVVRSGLRFFIGADVANALTNRRIDVRPAGTSDGLTHVRIAAPRTGPAATDLEANKSRRGHVVRTAAGGC